MTNENNKLRTSLTFHFVQNSLWDRDVIMDTYISGVYHAITCKFQWHLCVPAWMGFAWLTLLIKTHLVRHIYCQLTVHNSTHALARLHEKCGKTLDTGTGQLRSPNSNPFLFTSLGLFIYLYTFWIKCQQHEYPLLRTWPQILSFSDQPVTSSTIFNFFVSYSKTI